MKIIFVKTTVLLFLMFWEKRRKKKKKEKIESILSRTLPLSSFFSRQASCCLQITQRVRPRDDCFPEPSMRMSSVIVLIRGKRASRQQRNSPDVFWTPFYY